MTSDENSIDSGLLAPVWAGSDAAALVGDEAWVQAMLEVEVALARAQAHLGAIPAAAVGPIAAAAQAERIDLPALAAGSRGGANPVVLLVQLLTDEVGRIDPAAAEYVHRGGTSQDILDSAAMLIAARVFTGIDRDLTRTADALAGLADRYRGMPMAGRTLTQHAVPITFGLKAAGWLTLVLDAIERVRWLRESGLPAQLGGAAGTLASYIEYAADLGPGAESKADPARDPGHGLRLSAQFARELGLIEAPLPWPALRTPLADIAAVTTFVTGALGKMALDVQGLSRTEVAEVAEPGAAGRGVSSAMPQKRNPVLATLVMSAARQVPLYATVLAQCLLSEDERSAGGWHAEWQPLRECLRLTGGAASTAAELAEGLHVFPERLLTNLRLGGGTIVSERLAVALAPRLGKAAAKKLVGRIALDPERPFDQGLLAAPELAGFDPASLRRLLDPGEYLGASDLLVDRALARHHGSVTRMRDYQSWHRAYDDPDSGLSWRLRVVQGYLRQALDRHPGPIRLLSVCSGDGRDVIGVLAGRDDADRVTATLIEIHPKLAEQARESARAAGLDRLEVRTADAGNTDAYAGAVPADVVVLVGILGNISDADLAGLISGSAQFCRPGATLLWSRGRDRDDRNDIVRERFAAAGFTELDYATRDFGSRPALGAMRYDGAPEPLRPGRRIFTFLR